MLYTHNVKISLGPNFPITVKPGTTQGLRKSRATHGSPLLTSPWSSPDVSVSHRSCLLTSHHSPPTIHLPQVLLLLLKETQGPGVWFREPVTISVIPPCAESHGEAWGSWFFIRSLMRRSTNY